MLDSIALATADDLDAIWQLYVDVCAQQERDAYSPLWTLGVYPSRDDFASYLAAGELYIGWHDGRVSAAMVLTKHDDPEYQGIDWPTPAADDEVAVIHLLAVHPRLRGKHVGQELAREAICLARTAGKRVIRLDVVPSNLIASRIYRAEGFTFVGQREIYYEDVGHMAFELYEYVL